MKTPSSNKAVAAYKPLLDELRNHKVALKVVFERVSRSDDLSPEEALCSMTTVILLGQIKANIENVERLMKCNESEEA